MRELGARIATKTADGRVLHLRRKFLKFGLISPLERLNRAHPKVRAKNMSRATPCLRGIDWPMG